MVSSVEVEGVEKDAEGGCVLPDEETRFLRERDLDLDPLRTLYPLFFDFSLPSSTEQVMDETREEEVDILDCEGASDVGDKLL